MAMRRCECRPRGSWGTRKATEATSALVVLLNDSDAAVRFRAATALGRIGNAAAAAPLVRNLDEKDLFARYSMFKALNLIGRENPAAWAPIVAGIEQ